MNTVESANKLIDDLKEKEINIYPIKSHPLKDYSLDIQEVYIIILCILTNIDNQLNDNQQKFLKRLLIGIENEGILNDFYKKAIELPDGFVEQIIFFTDKELKFNLIMDMLLILGLADNKNELQIQLVSEIALILKIDLEDIEKCTKIAKSILEQNSRIIIDMTDKKNNLLDNFITYITDFYFGAISYNNNLIYGIGDYNNKLNFDTLLKYSNVVNQKDLFSNIKKELDSKPKKTITLTSKKIVFENYFLGDNNQLILNNCDTVQFINCTFDTISPLKLFDCTNILFKNCSFKNIRSKVIDLEECSFLNITECHFSHILSSNIIEFDNLHDFYLEHNIFEKISFKQLSESMFTVTDWPNKFIIKNNKFDLCKNISGFGALLLYSSAEPNKNSIIQIDNNIFENCKGSVIVNCEFLEAKNYTDNKIDNNIKFR